MSLKSLLPLQDSQSVSIVSPNSDYDRSKNSPSPTKFRSDIEEVETLQLTRKEKKSSVEESEEVTVKVEPNAEEEVKTDIPNTEIAKPDPK